MTSDKGVREVIVKVFNTHLDALLNEKFTETIVEIEREQYPETISLRIDGKNVDFRLKLFSRESEDGRKFIEKTYLKLH